MNDLTASRQTEAQATRRTPDIGMAQLLQADLQVAGPRRTRISEEYAIFAAQLLRARAAGRPTGNVPDNLIMITSTQPGEGKSFTAINLAASLARHREQQVILVDGDPKRHSLSERLAVADRQGLFDLIGSPGMALESLMLTTAIDRLQVLSIGNRPDENAGADRMVTMLHRIARKFPNRLVILDAPPCRATSDPTVISADMGYTLLVVEAERTQRSDLERSIAMLSTCPNILLMLNKTRFDTGSAYGTYGYYGA